MKDPDISDAKSQWVKCFQYEQVLIKENHS